MQISKPTSWIWASCQKEVFPERSGRPQPLHPADDCVLLPDGVSLGPGAGRVLGGTGGRTTMAAPPPSQHQAIPTVGKKAEHDRTRTHPPPQEKFPLKATSCLASGQPGFLNHHFPLNKETPSHNPQCTVGGGHTQRCPDIPGQKHSGREGCGRPAGRCLGTL